MKSKYSLILFVALWHVNISCNNTIPKSTMLKSIDTITAQPFSEYHEEPCLSGIDSARNEAKNGIYTFLVSGLTYATEFNKFYKSYLKKNYNVKLIVSCDGPPIQANKLDCYYSQANNEVDAKYGKGFIALTTLEAKKLFKGTLQKED